MSALPPEIRFATNAGVLDAPKWTLGDVVRKLRLAKEWTQEQLATKAGVNTISVVRLERESEKSERQTIERVARALDVAVADLYAYVDELSLSAGLSEGERRTVMLFQRRLIEKRQQASGDAPLPALPRDRQAPVHEVHEPAQKRQRRR